MRRLLVLIVCGLLAGCGSHYVVPGPAADMRALGVSREALTDAGVQEQLNRRPLAKFPAVIALARVQGSGYRSYSLEGYGGGAYSVVTVREVESDEVVARLARLPMVSGVATVNRLLLTQTLRSDLELRQAAAAVHADLLLVYTFDTTFRTDDFAPPLSVVTLGLSPNKAAHVTTTASAALLDTRNGYVYALAEATARESQLANAWTDEQAADQSRLRAERRAFEKLVDDFGRTWSEVLTNYHRP